MPSDIFIERGGHRTWLKWHRARRRGTDPAFTSKRILEGMAEGASIEVDLVVHGDNGFAVLHDLVLDRDTTGTGPVREASAETLRALNLRANDGTPLPDKVMVLEDLAALLTNDGAHRDALLQLDYKEDASALDERTVANFTTALAPVARHFILSSGNAPAVRVLSANLPELKIGYDPCFEDALERLQATRDYLAFVTDAIATSPNSQIDYLAYPLVLAAEADGYDIIKAFHQAGRRIDAYTIQHADPEGIAIAEHLLALNVDQITTDDPVGLGAALAG